MKRTHLFSDYEILLRENREFVLPVKEVINLKVEHDGITVGINLTKSEALEVIGKLTKHLDVRDVLTAVTKAANAK